MKAIFTTVSAAALLMAIPAFAQTGGDAQVRAQTQNQTRIQNERVFDFQRAQNQNQPFLEEMVRVNPRKSAQGIIGANTYNADGETVATVEDIIIDQNGNARTVVLREGGFLGLGGDLRAVEYDRVIRTEPGGDALTTVDETILDQSASADIRMQQRQADPVRGDIPPQGLSVAEILNAEIVNDRNETVAQVENLTFRNGEAEHLIVSFDDFLGMGGETAALNFSELQPSLTDGQVSFRLSARQSADLSAYKNRMTR